MVLGSWYWPKVLHVMKLIKGLSHSIVMWPRGDSCVGELTWPSWPFLAKDNEASMLLVSPPHGVIEGKICVLNVVCLHYYYYFLSLSLNSYLKTY